MREAAMNRRRGDKLIGSRLFFRAFVLLLISVYIMVTYWLFWPYAPAVVNGSIRIMNEDRSVEAGGDLIYGFNVEKNIDIPADVYKQLVNTVLVTYSKTHSHIPLGKRDLKSVLRVPRYAEPGEYRLRMDAVYKVNPIRSVTVTAWSEHFHVTEGG